MPASAIVAAAARAPWTDAALAMLPWRDDMTLIEYHIDQLRAAGARDIEVVLGHDAERVIGLVTGDNVEPIVNGAWQADPASTWRAGASALVRGTARALVIDVAEPRPADVLRALLDAHERSGMEITAPAFEGRRGTPVVMGERALAALRNLRGDPGLDATIARFADETQDVAFDSDIVLRRIDSPAAYEDLRVMLA